MKTIVKIKLDLCRHNYAALVQAIQNDSETRLVKALLLSDGKPWKIPPGATAAVAYRKPDQTKGLYDKLADGTPALEISGPTVTLALTQQMLTVPGKIQAGIVFFDENLNQLTTFPFTVAVEEDPFSGAQVSADYIRLQWLEDQLDEHLRQAKESGEFDGQSVLLLEDRVEYQTASSGQTPPEGDWLSTIPQTPQGSYLWTRRTKLWSGQEPIVDYSVAYQGLDGGIASVDGVEPDETGNVTLTPVDVGAAEPEEVQNLFRKASPINLLDNSDFSNPVAQAGIGGNHGNQAYAIDRWILTSGSVSQQEGGLQLNGTITQKLEHLPTGEVSAFVGMASGQASISYSDGAVTITSSGGVIAWAALYILPPLAFGFVRTCPMLFAARELWGWVGCRCSRDWYAVSRLANHTSRPQSALMAYAAWIGGFTALVFGLPWGNGWSLALFLGTAAFGILGLGRYGSNLVHFRQQLDNFQQGKPIIPGSGSFASAESQLAEIRTQQEEAVRTAVTSERFKVELISNVSHDLHTPLTTMPGTRIYLDVKETDTTYLVRMMNTASYEMDFQADEIVQRFSRGDKARSTQGSGLGLAIAQTYTQSVGGSFRVSIDGDQFSAIVELPKTERNL